MSNLEYITPKKIGNDIYNKENDRLLEMKQNNDDKIDVKNNDDNKIDINSNDVKMNMNMFVDTLENFVKDIYVRKKMVLKSKNLKAKYLLDERKKILQTQEKHIENLKSQFESDKELMIVSSQIKFFDETKEIALNNVNKLLTEMNEKNMLIQEKEKILQYKKKILENKHKENLKIASVLLKLRNQLQELKNMLTINERQSHKLNNKMNKTYSNFSLYNYNIPSTKRIRTTKAPMLGTLNLNNNRNNGGTGDGNVTDRPSNNYKNSFRITTTTILQNNIFQNRDIDKQEGRSSSQSNINNLKQQRRQITPNIMQDELGFDRPLSCILGMNNMINPLPMDILAPANNNNIQMEVDRLNSERNYITSRMNNTEESMVLRKQLEDFKRINQELKHNIILYMNIYFEFHNIFKSCFSQYHRFTISHQKITKTGGKGLKGSLLFKLQNAQYKSVNKHLNKPMDKPSIQYTKRQEGETLDIVYKSIKRMIDQNKFELQYKERIDNMSPSMIMNYTPFEIMTLLATDEEFAQELFRDFDEKNRNMADMLNNLKNIGLQFAYSTFFHIYISQYNL